MCLTAWKLPIGLPNCSRTLAYSVAVSSIQRASPAASAASTVAARSAKRWRGSRSASAGAIDSVTRASGREKSVAVSGSTRDAVGGRVDHQHPIARGEQQHTVGQAAQHELGTARRACPRRR